MYDIYVRFVFFFRLLELLLRLGADPNIGDEYSTYFAIAREQRFDPMSGNYTSVILEFIMVLSCIQFTFYLTFISLCCSVNGEGGGVQWPTESES